MLTIKDVNISEEAVRRILDALKSFWVGIPKWLRTMLIVCIIGGGGYFLYTRISMSYDMELLQTEVAELNEKYTTSVLYDRYVYDISNVIQAAKSLENEVDLMYSYHEETLDLMIRFLSQHHPTDPLIDELKSLKKRTEEAKKSYDKVLDYQISLYKDWEPQHKNFENPAEVEQDK